MNRAPILLLSIFFFLPVTGLGQLTRDYSEPLAELKILQQEWQELGADDVPQNTKDAIDALITSLVNLLELGGDAGDLGISDSEIEGQAHQLINVLIAVGSGSAGGLSGNAQEIGLDLEDVARELEDEAETGRLLGELPVFPEANVLQLFDPNAPIEEIFCSVRVGVVRRNPDRPNRFASFNITAAGAPGGGMFTETIKGFEVEFPGFNDPFASGLLPRDIHSDELPQQELTLDNQEPLQLIVSKQIWKDVRITGSRAPDKRWRIEIKVEYFPPSGGSCSAGKTIFITDSSVSISSGFLFGN